MKVHPCGLDRTVAVDRNIGEWPMTADAHAGTLRENGNLGGMERNDDLR